jgi:lysophospholipid acyltransferase (LPLAT)-like uncharacterized protein
MSAPWYKRLVRNGFVQSVAGNALAGYLLLVDRTARKVDTDLGQKRADLLEHLPAIFTFWHGEHFLVALAAHNTWDLHAMISRSADGSVNAIAAEKLGAKPVRGAGDPKNRGKQKGGARAFLRFLNVLEAGGSVGMTADVPKVARKVSPGLIRLAKKSGRPIVPVSYVTHPRITLSSWDRASLVLPFAKAAIGVSEPIYIDDDTAEDEEALCALVGERLSALEAHSYAQIGGRSAFAPLGQTGGAAHG